MSRKGIEEYHRIYCDCINWHPPKPGTRLCSYCGKHKLNEKERQEQIKKAKAKEVE